MVKPAFHLAINPNLRNLRPRFDNTSKHTKENNRDYDPRYAANVAEPNL